MITGTLKNQIDKIWDDLASYGVSDPIVAIEQMTYLFFIKSLDDLETSNEKKDEMLQITSKRIFPQTEEGQAMRWSKFCNLKAEEIFEIIGQKVFPFIQKLKTDEKSAYARYMRDAKFALPNALITEKVVTAINNLPLNDRDLKGDVYEYMISKLQTSGRNGQFRTPRHIISMMVELMEPQITDVIADPACGTGGFLVGAGTYVREHNKEKLRLDKKAREHYQNAMFTGYDTNQTMLRISAMNTILHEMDNADIRFMDSLSKDNPDTEKYSLILANPPFTGSLDNDAVAPTLTSTVKTKKTELLFIALFLRMLDSGGRCACIVPDGVMNNTNSKAYTDLRKELVDKHKLQAVISMPNGVFRPYAGVATGILIFTKTGTGGTDKVWFYDMQADGYTLDDKRAEDKEHNDIPDIKTRFKNLSAEEDRKRTDQSFMVPVQEIRDKGYLLSFNAYGKKEYVPEELPTPAEIIADIDTLKDDLIEHLNTLHTLLDL